MTRRAHHPADHSHTPKAFCATDPCAQAVKRAYTEMLADGCPERFANEAALAVFRWHHPEISAPYADAIVHGWVKHFH